MGVGEGKCWERCGKGWGVGKVTWKKCIGGVEECLGVWESVLGCGGKCKEMLREVWGNVLGCGGRCGKVCWGVGKVRGR